MNWLKQTAKGSPPCQSVEICWKGSTLCLHNVVQRTAWDAWGEAPLCGLLTDASDFLSKHALVWVMPDHGKSVPTLDLPTCISTWSYPGLSLKPWIHIGYYMLRKRCLDLNIASAIGIPWPSKISAIFGPSTLKFWMKWPSTATNPWSKRPSLLFLSGQMAKQRCSLIQNDPSVRWCSSCWAWGLPNHNSWHHL